MNKKSLIPVAAISIAALVLLAGILAVSIAVFASGEIPYGDVRKSDWFYDVVKDAYAKGLMNGRTEVSFVPGGDMTRAEVVTVLSRLAGDDISSCEAYSRRFADVEAGKWYENYIGWAAKAGLAEGYPDGTFRPDASVNRAEFAALVSRFADYKEFELPTDHLRPQFSDADKVPSWAKEYIERLRLAGILAGDNERRVGAQNTLTRAEAAAVAVRIDNLFDADPMYVAAAELSDRLITRNGRICLTFGDENTLTVENFSKLILRNQLGLDVKLYTLEMNDDELSALRKSYGALSDGESAEAELTVSICNTETKEKTEEKAESFLFIRDSGFEPDRGPVYEYRLLLDGSCEIVGWKDPAGWSVVTIPSELNGIPVSAIGDDAFSEWRTLRELNIAEGISKIGSRAFALCTSLERAVLPNSVTEIGRGAFYYCQALTKVQLPASLEGIPDYMFYMCSSLKRITLPMQTSEIGAFAFNHTSVSNVYFHEGIKKIGDYSFEETEVSSVVLPASCQYVGNWAFYNCRNVNLAYLNKELDYIGSGVFYGCGDLSAVGYGGSRTDWERFESRNPVLDGKTVNFCTASP